MQHHASYLGMKAPESRCTEALSSHLLLRMLIDNNAQSLPATSSGQPRLGAPRGVDQTILSTSLPFPRGRISTSWPPQASRLLLKVQQRLWPYGLAECQDIAHSRVSLTIGRCIGGLRYALSGKGFSSQHYGIEPTGEAVVEQGGIESIGGYVVV